MRSAHSLGRVIAVSAVALAPVTLMALLIIHLHGGEAQRLLEFVTVVVAVLSGVVLASTWWRHDQAPLRVFDGALTTPVLGAASPPEGFTQGGAKVGTDVVALGEASHGLPELLASSPVVFAIYDASGTCVMMDGAALHGPESRTGVGTTLDQLRASQPSVADALELTLTGGVPTNARHEDDSSVYDVRYAPLWRDGRVVGAVGVGSDVTAQRRLEQQRERTNRQQAALARMMATAAYARLDVEAVAQSIADLAVEEIGEGCDVRLVDDDGETMRVIAVQHIDLTERRRITEILQSFPLRVGTGICGTAVATGRPVLAPTGDAELLNRVAPGASAKAAAVSIGAYLAFPLRSGGRIVGSFALHRRQGYGTYSQDDISFAEVLAARAAMALDVSLLYRDVQRESEQRRALAEQVARSLGQQRELLQQLLDTEERERSRLAEDIHDDPLQVLVAALLRIGLIRTRATGEIQTQLAMVESTLEDVGLRLRRVMFDLTPPDLSAGLASAVRRLADSVFDDTGVSVRVEGDLVPLPAQTEAVSESGEKVLQLAHRITREALINVRKHARARHVRVSIRRDNDVLVVEVIDDGRGTSTPTSDRQESVHLGMASMERRAAAAGGSVSFRSEPGVGSALCLQLPLEAVGAASVEVTGA